MFHFLKWKWDPIKNEIPRGFHHCSNSEIENGKQKVLKPFRFQDFFWSEWRDLNSRPLDPQSSALPTALHPDILFCCASRGQLVYINMTVMKLQPLISIFLNFFCKRDSMKTCWQSPQLYGIILKVFRRRTAFTMERCPSGWRNRSWKPATCKRPWVRIPLSPPLF